MTSPSHADFVIKLRNEYPQAFMYGDQSCTVHTEQSIENIGFMGSKEVCFFTSSDSIFHEAPACIAAPLVNMVAKNIIGLGMAGQGFEAVPVRLYAPEQLFITTKHLLLGDLIFLEEPKRGFISCEKLTFLIKPTEEGPDYEKGPDREIVKSWAINDNMEVEIIPTPL